MFGVQRWSPWPLPTVSTRKVVRCVGRTGAWYVKRTRNMLYKEYEDDLYTAIPTISVTVPVSGPLNVTMRDVDTKATSTNTEFSVDAKAAKPPQATGIVPEPGVDYADTAFNTVRETNETVTDSGAAKSSPASTRDKRKSPHLKDQGIISKDHFIPPVSSSPGPRYADNPHQQSLDQHAFEKLRRAKRADPSNALPNGHSRNISDSSDASTLINSPGGGSRKHSLTALDLASFTHRIEVYCQKTVVATLGLKDAAQICTIPNADPADANAIDLDMAHSKIEAYKLAATSLRSEKETLIKENDITLQRAAGVAQGLRYELDSLKKNYSQALKEGTVRNEAEKAALRAEITRLCGNVNDMGLQLGLLQSSYHSLETEYESEKRQHMQLSESFLRLTRGRIEQLDDLKALEKAIAKTRHDLGDFAGDCFECMVRLTLALKDQGIDAMDEEYKRICEHAPYHVGFDERDIVNSVKEEIEEEENRKNRAAGGEAGNENPSKHEILEQEYDVKAPKSEAGQESPETYDIRRRREIAEAEERLLGPIGIAISADGTVKNVQAAKGQLHPDHVRYALNSGPDGGTIDDKTPSKTGKSKDISGQDWQNGASEIRSVFQRPRPANYELLDLPAPGSSVKGQMVTKDDLKNVLPGLNVNATIPNHDFGTAETDTNPILNPAYAGTERSGHAHDISHLLSNKSTSSIESNTMDVMPPKENMAKPSPLVPNHRDEYEAAHQDPVISSMKVAAATDVDRNLHPSRDDEAWLQGVLANIAMEQDDHLQSSRDLVAFPVESDAEEDLAASSDFEGEDLDDNQDQVFVDDEGYVGNDCNESVVSYAVDTKSDAMQLRESVQGIEEEQDPTTSDKTDSKPSDLTNAASSDGKSSGVASSEINIPPIVSGAPSNDRVGSASSTLGHGNHIQTSSPSTRKTVSDRDTPRFPSASSLGVEAIQPALANTGLMVLAETAAASPYQHSSHIDLLDANPTSGKTNAELGQAEREQGNGDISRFDNEARGRDLSHFATIVDQAKFQAPISASKSSFSLPRSESFDFVSKSASPPSINSRKPLFPTVSSENNAESHAGFSFSPDFVANDRATLPAEAAVIPSAPDASGVEVWRASQSSSQTKPEFGSAGTPTPKRDSTCLNTVTQVHGVEEIVTSPNKSGVHGTTAAKADHVQSQLNHPTSPKSYSPPRLSRFSFRSEDLGQPGLSSLHDDSVRAVCDGSQNTSPTIPKTQPETPPVDKKLTDQAKPAKPDPNVLEPTSSSAATVKVKAKATKPKMTIATAIALQKHAIDQMKVAEEKQREHSRKQREAAVRRKKDAGGKGGRA